MPNPQPSNTCAVCSREGSKASFCSQGCRVSAMPNRRSISEPATPVSPIDLPTGMCELFPLPKPLDFERLTPSGCKRVARNTEPQQGVRNTSTPMGSVISHEDYLELKNCEKSFDQSRRWEKPICTFTHTTQDVEFQRITVIVGPRSTQADLRAEWS